MQNWEKDRIGKRISRRWSRIRQFFLEPFAPKCQIW